jgi:hypothetical protein
VRDNFHIALLNKAKNLVITPVQYVANLLNIKDGESMKVDQAIAEVALQPLKNIAPGVYAKEKGDTNYIIIKEDEIEYVEMTVETSKGPIKVRVPKVPGMQLPSQEDFEAE